MKTFVTSPTFWIDRKNPRIISYGNSSLIDPNKHKMIMVSYYKVEPVPKEDEIWYKYENNRGYLLKFNTLFN